MKIKRNKKESNVEQIINKMKNKNDNRKIHLDLAMYVSSSVCFFVGPFVSSSTDEIQC